MNHLEIEKELVKALVLSRKVRVLYQKSKVKKGCRKVAVRTIGVYEIDKENDLMWCCSVQGGMKNIKSYLISKVISAKMLKCTFKPIYEVEIFSVKG